MHSSEGGRDCFAAKFLDRLGHCALLAFLRGAVCTALRGTRCSSTRTAFSDIDLLHEVGAGQSAIAFTRLKEVQHSGMEKKTCFFFAFVPRSIYGVLAGDLFTA